MLKSIKELKKELDVKFLSKNIERDEEGRAVIEMNVRDDSSFLSDYSMADTPVISSEVAGFLEDRTAYLLPEEPLSLRVYSGSITDEEKVIYRKAIACYYADRYASNQREYKKNLLSALFMALAGIAFLAAMIVCEHLLDNVIWTEVLDIVAWVFLWEATYMLMIENRLVSFKRKRYLSLTAMKITFIDTP